MASGHILPSLAFLAHFHLTNPQPFIFYFGPGGSFCLLGASRLPSQPLSLVGFGPFRPPTDSTVGPKPQLGPPEPLFVTNSLDPKLAINRVGPFLFHGPPWTNIPAMASGNHQRPPDQLSQPSPQLMGNTFHSFMPSVLEAAGVVHIWYYIPLCTIFAQKSNGDVFRTHFHLSISRSQNPTPISKEDHSTHQSDKLWRQSEDSSRIPTTCIFRSWAGTLFRIIQKGKFSRGITSIQSVVKASSISILL
ncbi:hypothetical protein O181_099312 [Austropuccinia psidii MF-1]|uniref:Uncharacterized protein n=1 Tax=Austropuccinia psidii MF-1 TaxID=1389203 RepID=A0A9Q3PGE3_9BASI|nr:hypothetical protein [Austropuccinia psidii MF-1]